MPATASQGITSEEVRGWFVEWLNSRPDRQRGKPLPEEKHCRELAKWLSAALQNTSDPGARILAQEYNDYFAKINEATEALRPALKSLQKARKKWDRLPEPKVELPFGFDPLCEAIEHFLSFAPGDDGAGFGFNMDVHIFSSLTANALVKAKWKKSAISLTSDGGPVMFVVCRCLDRLGYETTTPAALGRRLRGKASKARKNNPK